MSIRINKFISYDLDKSFIVKKSGLNYTIYQNNNLVSTGADCALIVNNLLNSIRVTGGFIKFDAGTFNLSSTINLQGDDTYGSSMVRIEGLGITATKIVPNPGIDAFTMHKGMRCSIKYLEIIIDGNSKGLYSWVSTSNIQQSVWQSEFKHLQIRGLPTHVGFGIYADNIFRCVIENVQIGGCCNLVRFDNVVAGFNSGDSLIQRCTWDNYGNLNPGKGLEINSTVDLMNQNTFINVIIFGGSDLPWPQTLLSHGIKLNPRSDNNSFIDCNVERCAVAVSIDGCAGTYMDFSYMICTDTYFKLRNATKRSIIKARYVAMQGGLKFLDDTSTGGRNIIRDTTTKENAVTPATNIHGANTVFENVWDEAAGMFLS